MTVRKIRPRTIHRKWHRWRPKYPTPVYARELGGWVWIKGEKIERCWYGDDSIGGWRYRTIKGQEYE